MTMKIQIWSCRWLILQRIVSGSVFVSLDISLHLVFFVALFLSLSLCVWSFCVTGSISSIPFAVCSPFLCLVEGDLIVILCIASYGVFWSAFGGTLCLNSLFDYLGCFAWLVQEFCFFFGGVEVSILLTLLPLWEMGLFCNGREVEWLRKGGIFPWSVFLFLYAVMQKGFHPGMSLLSLLVMVTFSIIHLIWLGLSEIYSYCWSYVVVLVV